LNRVSKIARAGGSMSGQNSYRPLQTIF
jgi:hypothetical protein